MIDDCQLSLVQGNVPARAGLKPDFPASIINYQLSIINYQLSIINYQLSIINYQMTNDKGQ